MATPKKKPLGWNDAPIESMGPSERLAHEIVSARRDLLPSVERIMDAGLADDERQRALELFQASLGNVGDPHRDPRVAIANSATS